MVACSKCQKPWTLELRHKTSSCPRCGKQVEVAKRTRLWQGESPTEARAAAASLQASMEGVVLEDSRPVPRHDSAIDAAAAKANAVINKSQKAEAIALWLTRLQGPSPHADYLQAMRRAGLDGERAQKEVTRMLAMDVIYEPTVGKYAALE